MYERIFALQPLAPPPMYQRVLGLLKQQANLFLQDDREALLSLYSNPFVMVMPFRSQVFLTAAELSKQFAKQREHHRSRGLLGIRTNLAAVEVPRNGRLRAWTRCYFEYPDGPDALPYDVVYHLSDRQHGLIIEMAVAQRPTVRDADLIETAAATG